MPRASSTTARTGRGLPRRPTQAQSVAVAALPQPPTADADADAAPTGLRRWLARARTLGLTPPQLVFELHVRQGVPLLTVAQVLGLGIEAVQAQWDEALAARAARAPQAEADFARLREHLSAVLWQTVEATYPDAAQAVASAAPSPPMLSVRLKAVDQIARLYDLTLEQTTAAAFPTLPYATPEEIAHDVRQRVLELHGRDE